jgi:hypothetical protein
MCQCCLCYFRWKEKPGDSKDDIDEDNTGDESFPDYLYRPYVKPVEKKEEASELMRLVQKVLRKRWGGLEPKWARQADISTGEAEDLWL